MSSKSNHSFKKPQVVVVSADIAVNASLQKQLNEKDYPCRGFFDITAAINWSGIHKQKNIIYLLIPPFKNLPLVEAINLFYKSDGDKNCIAFADAKDFEKTERSLSVYESLLLLPKGDNFNILPALLRQIAHRMNSEQEVAALTKLKPTEGNQPATISDELTDIDLRRFNRKERQEKYFNQNSPEKKINHTFLKNVGLEIRNPVSAIVGMARTLEKTRLDEDQKTCLKSIILSANNLLTFMDDMLYYANITSGKQELVYHTFNVRSMVNEVVALFGKQTEKKGIQLHHEVRQSVPESITGDKLKIQQALNNLLAFAIHNTEQGGVDLVIETITDQNREEFLSFSVKDSGKGLKEEEIALVFDSFFRRSDADYEEHQWAGLGLSIVKGLAELMRGNAGIESVLGEGSHAYFSIPLLSMEEASVADEQTQYAAPKKKLKILFAEDDAINQMYLAGFLRSHGWEVDAVYNGEDALKLLNNGLYDLIILDGQMPKMDGFETAQVIRDAEARSGEKITPILAISGYASPEDKERFFKAGMDAYLSKPVDEQELIRVICNLTQ